MYSIFFGIDFITTISPLFYTFLHFKCRPYGSASFNVIRFNNFWNFSYNLQIKTKKKKKKRKSEKPKIKMDIIV